MTSPSALTLPDHTQLPDSDGKFVFAKRVGDKNLQEHPQSILITDSIKPIYVAPLIVLEFVSGDGAEERDTTSPSQGNPGKFWVYEQAIRVPYYGIYEVAKAQVEVYHLVDNTYQLMQPNERGHYPISPMGVELGIWQGLYQNAELPWLRWWDAEGNLLLIGEERAEVERQKRERIVEKLRGLSPEQLEALGINPELLE
ncbi:MAG: Uma2 family endonuclease [Cyanomargarita calcarea GSE-NOS-MK-12-04C]|jgi:hypothetical protein|uniref:Uma2 family endonuclease n=1 Tax=Cyanomargarita calcarea GSE-NOS-MK-12-04C TaxID=2839659 RepID=A0A951QMR4_9CYAN|nr:Uma2 family endonuclease [Cyanomargarita calcarea GSE-NOS-MK-12-04C]